MGRDGKIAQSANNEQNSCLTMGSILSKFQLESLDVTYFRSESSSSSLKSSIDSKKVIGTPKASNTNSALQIINEIH